MHRFRLRDIGSFTLAADWGGREEDDDNTTRLQSSGFTSGETSMPLPMEKNSLVHAVPKVFGSANHK